MDRANEYNNGIMWVLQFECEYYKSIESMNI